MQSYITIDQLTNLSGLGEIDTWEVWKNPETNQTIEGWQNEIIYKTYEAGGEWILSSSEQRERAGLFDTFASWFGGDEVAEEEIVAPPATVTTVVEPQPEVKEEPSKFASFFDKLATQYIEQQEKAMAAPAGAAVVTSPELIGKATAESEAAKKRQMINMGIMGGIGVFALGLVYMLTR